MGKGLYHSNCKRITPGDDMKYKPRDGGMGVDQLWKELGHKLVS